jgi:hypothetical protein
VKVFVSYSRKDAEFVSRIERDLTGLGYDVWVDTEDILADGHARWRRSIVAAIRESEVMVLVLSPNSTHSDNVERELSVAADNFKRVVPILYRECELPDGFQYELAGVQHIDFARTDFNEGVRQLAAYLGPAQALPSPVSLPIPRPKPVRTTQRYTARLGLIGAVLAGLIGVGALIYLAVNNTADSTPDVASKGPAFPIDSDSSPSIPVGTTASGAPSPGGGGSSSNPILGNVDNVSIDQTNNQVEVAGTADLSVAFVYVVVVAIPDTGNYWSGRVGRAGDGTWAATIAINPPPLPARVKVSAFFTKQAHPTGPPPTGVGAPGGGPTTSLDARPEQILACLSEKGPDCLIVGFGPPATYST